MGYGLPVSARTYRRAGKWYVDLRFDDPATRERGRKRRVLQARTKAEAEAEARALALALDDQVHRPKKRAAFSGLAKRWLEARQPTLKLSSYLDYESVCRVHLVPEFGHADVRTITTERIELFRARLASDKAPKTVNNILGVLRKLLDDGRRWGYLDENPAADIRKLRLPDRTPTWWTPEQSEAALAAAERVEPGWHLWLLLSLRTGMRFGELAALRWSDVVLEGQTPHVLVRRAFTRGQETTPKNHRTRRVPLTPAAVGALSAAKQLAEGRRVLVRATGASGPIALQSARKALRRVVAEAGVPALRVHDLRHTFCSQLAASGVPLVLIQQWAGHRDIQTTMRYAHLPPC